MTHLANVVYQCNDKNDTEALHVAEEVLPHSHQTDNMSNGI